MGQIDEAYEPKLRTFYTLVVKEDDVESREKDQLLPEHWKGSVEEHGSAVIENYNSHLGPGESIREYVGVEDVRQQTLESIE
jgi:hypothetical protein